MYGMKPDDYFPRSAVEYTSELLEGCGVENTDRADKLQREAGRIASELTSHSTERQLASTKNTDGDTKVVKPEFPIFPCCGPYAPQRIPEEPDLDTEIVTSVARCREISHTLLREQVLGVAAEGIQLGIHGPIMLMQIATCNKKVYIFDLLKNRQLCDQGRLRSVLESDQVLKVIYSCASVSAALYSQLAVTLRNVFDTQIAHRVIEGHKGKLLPPRIQLSDICQRYSESSSVYDWKADAKEMWVSDVGEFWGQRPLSQDMIDFACGDVIVLIPEVYKSQRDYLEENGLMNAFRNQVEEEILVEFDEVVQGRRKRRLEKTAIDILHRMREKYHVATRLYGILEEDERRAIQIVPFDETEKISKTICRLKTECLTSELQELEDQLRLSGVFIVDQRHSLLDNLKACLIHPDENLQERAKRVQEDMNRLLIESIERKFSPSAWPYMLSEVEKDSLRLSLDPATFHCKPNGPIVTSLYWQLMEDDFDQIIVNYKFNNKDFHMAGEEYRKMQLYAAGTGPASLKLKSEALIKAFDRKYGKGNYPSVY